MAVIPWFVKHQSFNDDKKDSLKKFYPGLCFDYDKNDIIDLPLSFNSGFDFVIGTYKNQEEWIQEDDDVKVLILPIVEIKYIPDFLFSVSKLLEDLASVNLKPSINLSFAFKQVEIYIDKSHPWFSSIFDEDQFDSGLLILEDFYTTNISTIEKGTIVTAKAASKLGALL